MPRIELIRALSFSVSECLSRGRILLLSAVLPCLASSQVLPQIPNRTVSVIDYGAKPDDGNDDTWFINEAINALANQGGGTVRFPKGTYVINPDVYSRPVRTRSGIRLEGERDAAGNLLTILKMPRPYTNRAMIVIGDPAYANETTDLLANPSAVQRDVEISSLAFDLDNGHGRRAIQLRFRTQRVWIHDCTGFQSGLDRGEPEDTQTSGDNHFFNMASYSEPNAKRVSEDVVIERCSVRGNLQLTADGGGGITNLYIRDNQVTGAYSHGIAITTVSPEAYFDNITIENNQVLDIRGDGLYISHDGGNGRVINLTEGGQHRMSNVLVRNNRFELGPSSVANAGGVQIGTFKEMSNFRIEGNLIKGWSTSASTSRYGFLLSPWDLNWARLGRNPAVAASAFSANGRVTVPGHTFVTGMQIEVVPSSPADQAPQGIELYRRYPIKRIDANTIELCDPVSGRALNVNPIGAGNSQFTVRFSPGVSNISISNNTISASWDYAFLLGGGQNITIANNIIQGPVVLSGESEGLKFTENQLNDVLRTTDDGCSLLAGASAEPGDDTNCAFLRNVWSVSEGSLGPVYGVSAVVTIDPRDSKRQMSLEYSNNTVSFTNSGASKFTHGFRARGALGDVDLLTGSNSIGRGMDVDQAYAVSTLEGYAFATSTFSPIVNDSSSSQDSNSGELDLPLSENAGFTNLSTRAYVGAESSSLVVGFVISGTGKKRVLIRASGPALTPFGVDGVLLDPVVELRASSDGRLVASNDDWSRSTLDAQTITTQSAKAGAFAWTKGSKDAAVVVDLEAGGYTVTVTGKSGATGIALAEVYDVAQDTAQSRMTNVSARAMAKAGAGALMVGFRLKSDSARRVLVRSAGPALTSFGVGSALPDPKLKLVPEGGSSVLGSNNDWSALASDRNTLSAAFAATGAFAFAPGSQDSGMVRELSEGLYSAVTDDTQGREGVVLSEAYLCP